MTLSKLAQRYCFACSLATEGVSFAKKNDRFELRHCLVYIRKSLVFQSSREIAVRIPYSIFEQK